MEPTPDQIENVLRRLYRAHPERGVAPGGQLQIAGLTRITDGWETDVYAVTVRGERGATAEREPDALILRLYQGEGGAHKAEREFGAMHYLYHAGYPVPEVLLLEPSGDVLGKPFMVMERIAGRSMGAILADSDNATRLRLLQCFCRLLCDLHALDWQDFARNVAIHEQQDTRRIVSKALDSWQTRLRALSADGFQPAFAWLRDRLPKVQFAAPSVVHMDYHPHNVLVRDDGRAFVIDWPNAAISDYRLDLAWTLVLMGCHGNPDVAHHVLQAYEQSSGHAVEQLAFFEVAACLRRLISIVVSLRAGAEQLGMRPGAETMMKNVSHIENVYALLRDRAAVSIRDVDDLLSSLR